MALFLNRPIHHGITYRSESGIAGFTLLEVMVALAILAITLTSIYRLHGQTLMMSATARFYNQAPALAAMKLTEIERQGIKNSSDGSGGFGEQYPGYTWTIRIEPVTSDVVKDTNYQLSRIEINIIRDEAMTYSLRTYRFYAQ